MLGNQLKLSLAIVLIVNLLELIVLTFCINVIIDVNLQSCYHFLQPYDVVYKHKTRRGMLGHEDSIFCLFLFDDFVE